jgi:hypothetical protein
MTVQTSLPPEQEGDQLLETVVAAHFLALQMRMVAKAGVTRHAEATEYIAAALTHWARLVEAEAGLFDLDAAQKSHHPRGRQ